MKKQKYINVKEIKKSRYNNNLLSGTNELDLEMIIPKSITSEILFELIEEAKNIKIVYDVKEEILDEKEKQYLSNIIAPFKNKVEYIVKGTTGGINEYIIISILNDTNIAFPSFKTNEMYKNMKPGKKYKLSELGL